MSLATTDLCDAHPAEARVLDPIFRDFGGTIAFSGPVAIIKAHEDNPLVREALGQPGGGRVLVVDGGGSLRCAMLGGQLAEMAAANGWAGLVVYGCVRDAADLGRTAVGIKALASHPRKSGKKGEGSCDVEVTFAGTTIRPGDYLYADADGIVVSSRPLG